MTNRNPQSVTWDVLSVDSITTSAEKIALATHINTKFANMRSITLDQDTIQNMEGKTVEIQASITNFFGKSNTNSLILTMLSK